MGQSKRFDGSGAPQGGEFTINTTTQHEQSSPGIAALSNGGFVVIWVSEHQEGGGNGVYFQRYDASGVAQVAETLANTRTANHQENAAVIGLSGGGFVVVWDSDDQDGDRDGVFAQIFDANGSPAGQEFSVNTHIANNHKHPEVAALTDGGFVVAWVSTGQDSDEGGVYAQRYDASGAQVSGEFQANTTTIGDQEGVETIGLADGGFLIAWTSDHQAKEQVFAQRYDATGAAVGGETKISGGEDLDRSDVSLAERVDGSLAGAYVIEPTNSSAGLVGSLFGANVAPTVGAAGAVDFSGANAAVTVADEGGEFDALTAHGLTVEAWFYFDGVSDGDRMIVSKGNSVDGDRGYSIRVDGTELVARLSTNGSNGNPHNAATSVDLGETPGWRHVAMVIDPVNGEIKGYLDGSNAGWSAGHGAVSNAGYNGWNIDPAREFVIGAADNGAGLEGWGAFQVSDVRVWNTVRSQSDIEEDMARQLKGDEANLIANWRLDDGAAATQASNAVAGGEAGAVVNGPTFVAPRASVTTPFETATSGRLTANDADGDQLSFSIATGPANGAAEIDAETGVWSYTPDAGFGGTDTISYQVSDDMGGVDTINVTVTIG